MSKKKKRRTRSPMAMNDAVEQAIDQGLLRSAATMGQVMMEQVLKTDPKMKSLLEQIVTRRLERVLRKLGGHANDG
jgi:hypothetical protein